MDVLPAFERSSTYGYPKCTLTCVRSWVVYNVFPWNARLCRTCSRRHLQPTSKLSREDYSTKTVSGKHAGNTMSHEAPRGGRWCTNHRAGLVVIELTAKLSLKSLERRCKSLRESEIWSHARKPRKDVTIVWWCCYVRRGWMIERCCYSVVLPCSSLCCISCCETG